MRIRNDLTQNSQVEKLRDGRIHKWVNNGSYIQQIFISQAAIAAMHGTHKFSILVTVRLYSVSLVMPRHKKWRGIMLYPPNF